MLDIVWECFGFCAKFRHYTHDLNASYIDTELLISMTRFFIDFDIIRVPFSAVMTVFVPRTVVTVNICHDFTVVNNIFHTEKMMNRAIVPERLLMLPVTGKRD